MEVRAKWFGTKYKMFSSSLNASEWISGRFYLLRNGSEWNSELFHSAKQTEFRRKNLNFRLFHVLRNNFFLSENGNPTSYIIQSKNARLPVDAVNPN
jgi:hypothetical protein